MNHRQSHHMRVQKRDGRMEEVKFDEISERLKQLTHDLDIDPIRIATLVCSRITDGIKTSELDELSAHLCASLVIENSDFETLGLRILRNSHEKETCFQYTDIADILQKNTDEKNILSPILDQEFYSFIQEFRDDIQQHYTEMNNKYQLFDMSIFGWKTLYRAYLLKSNRKVVERPEHLFYRIALYFHRNDWKKVESTFSGMMMGKFIHATPTLYHAGTVRPQMSSCFLESTEDSIEAIFKTLSDTAMISKWAGGVGISITNIRAKNSYIRGTNGHSNGIMPMLKVFNDTSRYIDQGGGKRKGSFACFVKDTKVLTINEGVKNIQDVKIGDQVVTHKNRVRYVKQVHKNILDNRKIYKVSILGNRDIFVTGNHKFWSFYTKKYKSNKINEGWNSVEELKNILDNKLTKRQTCYVSIPNGTGIEYDTENYINVMDYKDVLLDDKIKDIKEIDDNKIVSISKGSDNIVKAISKPINKKWIVNKDLAKFFGIWLGDGCIKSCRNRINGINITVHNKNEKLINYIINTSSKIFGCNATTCTSKLSNVVEISINSRIVGKMFNTLFGKFFNGKRLPNFIFSWSKTLINHLLAGLITTDGHVAKNKTNITLGLSNEVLMNQLFHLCRNNGIKVTYLNCSVKKKNMTNDLYTISITKYDDIINYVDKFYNDNRMEKCIESNKHNQYLKILSISETERNDEYVYTLGVEEDHSYTVEGGIIVENCFIEPWHGDIFDFLFAKRNIGNEDERARDLFYGLWIPDLFMKRVEQNGKWSLMCPNKCIGLVDSYGKEFEELYEEYERRGEFIKQIEARDLWKEIIHSQIETGLPYMMYKDSCNSKSNQKNLGTIRNSNLCTEIIQYSSVKETAVCNLASVNLSTCIYYNTKSIHTLQNCVVYTKPSCGFCRLLKEELRKHSIKYIEKDVPENFAFQTVPQLFTENNTHIGGFTEVYDLYLRPIFDYNELISRIGILVENMNIVIDKNYYPTPECKKSNLSHRPIGLGVQGLADLFCKMRLEFDSIEARKMNLKIFETIYFAALSKSNELVDRFGKYSSFEGSPLSKGTLHFDMCPLFDKKVLYEEPIYDWENLRAKIKTYGTCNSLHVAPMPTASTSQILNQNECIEPYTSNLYVRRTLAGEYTIFNKYLIQDLKTLGLWNQDTIDYLIVNRGSVINFAPLPAFLRKIYRTAWEIPQKSLIEMAYQRQWFIDQSQSFNLFVADPSFDKLTKMHFYGWKNGIKTGSYYVRTKPQHFSQNFTIDPNKECTSCSA